MAYQLPPRSRWRSEDLHRRLLRKRLNKRMGACPVIVLSPDNQTNVASHGSLAEELASHGHLVVGVDHPFQVAATTIAGGQVAIYDTAMDTGDLASSVAAKIDERGRRDVRP